MGDQAISEGKPWRSVSCGVSPREAAAMTEDLRKKFGTKCGHYDPKTGQAIATSREARNAIIQHRNGIDRDGGYRDYTGK